MTFFLAYSPVKKYSGRVGGEVFVRAEAELGEDSTNPLRSIGVLTMEILDKIVRVPDIGFQFPRAFFLRVSKPFDQILEFS
jgi:hypothetical protein